ncbi:phosphoglycolate phosphatase [Dongia sedimenti]|uniref:Phosphoglycolate phosphatase n=1 Tax=Dongia sedimenti TaxID=3064282 RepID=A0ABU0YV75_9PROT|nr:phosphoglycolate phosphatase [Rhodospirillaceae bacterium R-7]
MTVQYPPAVSHGTIIFDLDGTLVDSAPDLADALDTLLLEQQLAPLGLDVARRLIGHGITNLVRRGLELRGVALQPEDLASHSGRFLELYSANLSRKTRPYPGVAAALAQLHAEGWRLGVCTNKLERYARQILSDLDLIRYFDVVAGPDTFGVSKPDPVHLMRAVESLHGTVARSIVVGDSEVDVATAKAAGIPIVAVSYGYSRTPLPALEPELIVDDFRAVPAAINTLRSAWERVT